LEASGLHVLLATHVLGTVLLLRLTLILLASAALSLIEHVLTCHLLLHHSELLLLSRIVRELALHANESALVRLILLEVTTAAVVGSRSLATHRHLVRLHHHVLLHLRHARIHLLTALVGRRLLLCVHYALKKLDYSRLVGDLIYKVCQK
jgi:hypothetical protein